MLQQMMSMELLFAGHSNLCRETWLVAVCLVLVGAREAL